MNSAHSTEYLATTRLRVGYKGKRGETSIAETSELSVSPGEFICLLGPNGVGKSTLIRTLAGIQAPLHGSIRLQGTPFDRLSPRERARGIGVVLTESLPIGMMDAYSLVALGRHPYTGWLGTLNQVDRDRIDWAFKSVNATGLERRRIVELSDGERQKISIARALAQETPLILLDEPTAFLDLPSRIEIIATLRNLAHQERIGVLMSSHELDLALRYADYLWVFTDEKKLVKGYPEELALNGQIANSFASEQVCWDVERGGFHTQLHSHLRACVSGSGNYANWTRRALERLGFIVTDVSKDCVLNIRISEIDKEAQWIVEHEGQKKHYCSIAGLIGWIRSRDWMPAENYKI